MEQLITNEMCSGNIGRGLDVVLGSENIAIVVLMLIVLLESSMIYYLLRSHFKIINALHTLHNAITILNERLGHHGNDDD